MNGTANPRTAYRARKFNSAISALGWVISFILGLGILPSLTALSESFGEMAPFLFRLSGPINPLKISIPLLMLYFWLRRRKISGKLRWALTGIFLLGLATTIGASLGCGAIPGNGIREWAAMTIGMLCAANLLVLEPRQRRVVVGSWAALIVLLAFLDKAFPAAIDWQYAHIFDPHTRWYDAQVASTRLLTGVFGFQSFAKLLSWVPWLALAFLPWLNEKRRGFILWVVFTALATGLILSTTQRGPFLGMLLGWVAYFAHARLRVFKRDLLMPGVLAAALIAAVTFIATPREIFQGRVEAAVLPSAEATRSAKDASNNINFRKIMWGISLESVANHPLGDACIPEQTFKERGVYNTHSHNLFLHQFRERGWLWGIVHLALWLFALISAWRNQTAHASALFAGLICIMAQGMFDHPWFVLNHSMILSLYLLASIKLSVEENEATPVEAS
ncbi:MAG: hypothetical protein EOP06_11780 [Proteobacteria bacterium]|nr:MAG: hypothetical protein EOP06_11780 [Pseudomonadota bacterium]